MSKEVSIEELLPRIRKFLDRIEAFLEKESFKGEES